MHLKFFKLVINYKTLIFSKYVEISLLIVKNNFFGHEHAKSKLISVVELILTRAYLRAGLKFAALKYAEKVHQFLSTIGNKF